MEPNNEPGLTRREELVRGLAAVKGYAIHHVMAQGVIWFGSLNPKTFAPGVNGHFAADQEGESEMSRLIEKSFASTAFRMGLIDEIRDEGFSVSFWTARDGTRHCAISRRIIDSFRQAEGTGPDDTEALWDAYCQWKEVKPVGWRPLPTTTAPDS